MQSLEVVGSCNGCFQRIPSLIDVPVDVQTELLTGVGHELPRTHGLRPIASVALESGLRHRQINEVTRKTVVRHGLGGHGSVTTSALSVIDEMLTASSGEKLHPFRHVLIPGNRDIKLRVVKTKLTSGFAINFINV